MQEVSDMKKNMKKWLRSILFTVGGAIAGLTYYYFIGCSSGTCPLTSHPLVTMVYMGLVGWLLSGVFRKGDCDKCNM